MKAITGAITRGSTTLHYAVKGTGAAAVLLIAPGGMQSSISMWQNQQWDPWTRLADNFTLIAMDQRNAGKSTGPVFDGDHGWEQYAEDQLAVLDQLGVRRCLLLGQCIGPSYIFELLKRAPIRFSAALLLQPIGVALHTTEPAGWKGTNVEATTHWFGRWADEMRSAGRASDEELSRLYQSMYAGRDFVFSASREELAVMTTPMLVTAGVDSFHPAETAREIARLAPNAELLEHWRGEDYSPAIHDKFVAFLRQHAHNTEVVMPLKAYMSPSPE